MFDVTTINLTADGTLATPDLGSIHVGSRSAAELEALLHNFRSIDPIQNHDADPQVVIQVSSSKWIVRTGSGKLFLYNARNSSEASAELDPAAIVQSLIATPRTAEDDSVPARPAPTKTPHRAIAICILASGVLLNAYTVRSVLQGEKIRQTPPVTLVTDARELTALQQSASGRYSTGDAPGDRAIEVTPTARVRFFKLTPGGDRLESEDGYRVGRIGTKVFLSTTDSGLVEIMNIDSVIYYRDVYRRTK
jgi:hypothetical protein